MNQAIIMAAGKGTRMNSNLPKVAHTISGVTMIECIINQLKIMGINDIVSVLGYKAEVIQDYIKDKSMIAIQHEQLGTGHAVMQAKQFENKKGKTLIINGDCPLIKANTLSNLLNSNNDYALSVLTVKLDDPKSYGRIVRNDKGDIIKIVEFKDCNEQEKKIKEINTGIYCVDNELLFNNLSLLENNNAQKEFYITDLVEIFINKGLKVGAVICDNYKEVEGVNDQIELSSANSYQYHLNNINHMNNGVVMIDAKSVYIDSFVEIGQETNIYPNVTIKGNTKIGKGCTILPNSFLNNAIIGDNCTIDSSRITDSELKDEITVGPNAHLRMGCVIDSKNRIGNFVELKNTKMGYNSRCAHLSYLGDSEVGANVNIGCGVVTVNYDGVNKFKTIIKDGAFVGSNCNLIAPIIIGEKALVAAGSTVNKNIEDGEMGIARPRQENLKDFGYEYKKKEKVKN